VTGIPDSFEPLVGTLSYNFVRVPFHDSSTLKYRCVLGFISQLLYLLFSLSLLFFLSIMVIFSPNLMPRLSFSLMVQQSNASLTLLVAHVWFNVCTGPSGWDITSGRAQSPTDHVNRLSRTESTLFLNLGVCAPMTYLCCILDRCLLSSI